MTEYKADWIGKGSWIWEEEMKKGATLIKVIAQNSPRTNKNTKKIFIYIVSLIRKKRTRVQDKPKTTNCFDSSLWQGTSSPVSAKLEYKHKQKLSQNLLLTYWEAVLVYYA